ncbi:hypothetical protein [Actinomadura litoris]|uniref:hypothetical protein n=1 Tax=Actinomadura litoris TaxID=2678616 RepID=UPI001FA70F66|nr:hypothetical protein [Actinomadura litoris]
MAAASARSSDRFPVTDAMCARLSPIADEYLPFLDRYALTRPDLEAGPRPLHALTPEAKPTSRTPARPAN